MASISVLFDGLGISVGTTVAGLIVAILSMLLQTLLKHRLIYGLRNVEKKAEELTSFLEFEISPQMSKYEHHS
ncbi:MAG: hypothetical protein KAR79_01540, partial [Simkaniaceae bacterium]|nr:hypothetical protein [Simkaniaceae bacterium]